MKTQLFSKEDIEMEIRIDKKEGSLYLSQKGTLKKYFQFQYVES